MDPRPRPDAFPEVVEGGTAWGDVFVAVRGAPRSPGWLGAGELFGPRLPAVLADLGAARGTRNPAVAGILLFEQYARRVVAPALAALHRDGAVLDARLPRVRVQVVDGSVRRLAFDRAPEPAVRPDGPVRAEVLDGCLAGNLDLAAAALRRHTRVGLRVLRGATSNALVMALLQMSWAHRDRAHHVADAQEWLRLVPGAADLVTVDTVCTGGERWMYVDRNTCCLAFRTAVNQAREQPYCSACPVLPPSTTAALFRRATGAYAARAVTQDAGGPPGAPRPSPPAVHRTIGSPPAAAG